MTQSAEGKSSVLIDGSALNIDITQSELGFGWNNLNPLVASKNSAYFFGGDIRVKNAKGVGTLLSKGNFTPEGRLNGYLGHYWSNANQTIDKNCIPSNLIPSLEDKKLQLISLYHDSLIVILHSFSKLIPDTNTRKKEVEKVLAKFDSTITRKGYPLLWFHTNTTIGINEDEPEIKNDIKKFRSQLKAALTRVYSNIVDHLFQNLRREIFIRQKQSLNSNYWRLLFFGFASGNALGFTRFISLDTTDLSNSFKNVNYWGWQAGLGLNGEWRRWRLGFTYARAVKSNFQSLSSITYTLRSTNNVKNTSLSTEEEITAYAGDYGSTVQNECIIDVVYNLPLDKKRTSHLLLNPYLRANWQSRNTSLLVNTSNVGLGMYFFKNDGNFLGGFYVELPDINNNMEKQKDLSAQNLRPAFNRLTIGITGKLGLNSILTW
ncbi:hypothetical protein BWI96_05975 [Siphonobacter sp. SORGH_AS_0500]|uniref:hypothetical protein n=1 Tax=Siphonobacter sp. SORGH_AS_0500 TaxID=1864824 RepID=UPI000CB815D1|nr:hypothetical protein [Siphonobacter sp. SORGH_AS_0500]PKK37415.1 hypothetical protein BWI96_05975 [Siphonobacter sp. SORGH_AS_0500]